jgi:hypothetical protein
MRQSARWSYKTCTVAEPQVQTLPPIHYIICVSFFKSRSNKMTNEEREAYVAKQPLFARIIAMAVTAVIMVGVWSLAYDFIMSKIDRPVTVIYQVAEPVVVKSPGQLASEAYVDRQLAKLNNNR